MKERSARSRTLTKALLPRCIAKEREEGFHYICRMRGDFFICAQEKRHPPARVLSLIPRRSGCCGGAWATGNSPSHIRVPYLLEGTFRGEHGVKGRWSGAREREENRKRGKEKGEERQRVLLAVPRELLKIAQNLQKYLFIILLLGD